MCYVFPAIIHRMEDYLLALEACKIIEVNIGPALALEAVTKDSENSDEHGEEKINFRSGMGPNYERRKLSNISFYICTILTHKSVEFMGDCFLKMATSISTFVQQPDENEFEFHVRRMLMLCNKNLFNIALGGRDPEQDPPPFPNPFEKKPLVEYIRTAAFSR